jgi:ubiquinol-cytochrome c reductase cytochrome b subunit
VIRRTVRAIDERVGGASWARKALNHVFPDHWTFMLGEVALYAFVVLVLTGVYLGLFFEASTKQVVYRGSYAPLHGRAMSAAYDSAVRLSFDVRAGLVFRQIHHWAALVFLAAIVAHASRVFFTGAFRKPRELNWIVGVTLAVLALANGFLGYSLLDDLLSGTGLRIAYSIGESIPLVGPWLVSLFFGGEWPGDAAIRRLFVFHELLVPGLIVALISVHLALIWRQKHTQFPGPGHTETNVVGSRLYPTYALKSISLLFGVFAVIALLGGLFQINPIWLYGPYEPAAVTTAAQPDWYVGWLEGALRLFPPWEVRVAGVMVPNPFFPGVLLPGACFALLYAYPFLERRFSHDVARHELLDRPRSHPVRTGIGVAALTWFAVLFVAGGQDVIASRAHLSVQGMAWVLRGALLVLPILTGAVAWAWCRSLAERTVPDAGDVAVVLEPADEPPWRATPEPNGIRRAVAATARAAKAGVVLAAVAYALGRKERVSRR